MEQVFFLRIDYDRLKEALDPPAPLQLSRDDVQEWLLDRGFHIGMRGWYADTRAVRQLPPSVIVSCDPVA